MKEYTLQISAGQTKFVNIDAAGIYFKRVIRGAGLAIVFKRDGREPIAVEQNTGQYYPGRAINWQFEAVGTGTGTITAQFLEPGEQVIDNRPTGESETGPTEYVGGTLTSPAVNTEFLLSPDDAALNGLKLVRWSFRAISGSWVLGPARSDGLDYDYIYQVPDPTGFAAFMVNSFDMPNWQGAVKIYSITPGVTGLRWSALGYKV